MSDERKPDDDEHWFWKFLVLPGPPWKVYRDSLYQRGITIVALFLLVVGLILIALKSLLKS